MIRLLGSVPLVTAAISFFGLGAVTLLAWRTLGGGGAPRAVSPSPNAVAG